MNIIELRCEGLKNPLGIDVKTPTFNWKFSYSKPNEGKRLRNIEQISYRILVATAKDKLQKGDENPDIWDSGEIKSRKTIGITYAGKKLISHKKYYWKVILEDNYGNKYDSLDTEMAFWTTGYLSPDDWNAKWIGLEKTEKTKQTIKDSTKKKPVEVIKTAPSEYLQKEFSLKSSEIKNIKGAYLYATALGEYMAYINGKRVGNRYFAPEWTNFHKRVYYQTYDITNLLKEGKNYLGAILGDGWYMGFLGPGDQVRQLHYGKERRFSCVLYIIYDQDSQNDQNESIKEVKTDSSWTITNNGPIRYADHFMGETFDSRKTIPNWTLKPLNPETRNKDLVEEVVDIRIQSQMHQPVQVFKQIKPISITTVNEEGETAYIFDMGQNMVGFCHLCMDGSHYQKSDQIILEHGEMLNENGTLHQENLRLAQQRDTYIYNEGKIDYHPRFTFHGFQYVKISGLKRQPTLKDLTGMALSSNPENTGNIQTSHPLLNQLISNIKWTQRDNMLSVPTDCPQRNERMGWMGDIYAFAQTAIYNMDMQAFLRKFCQNIRDGQTDDGRYPDFAPNPTGDNFMNSPGWADAGVLIPWLLYVNYGDKEILETHYQSAKKYISFVQENNPNGLYKKFDHNYGDWLNGNNIKADSYPKRGGALSKKIFATLLLARSVKIMSKIAHILGYNQDKMEYLSFYEKIKCAFYQRYVRSPLLSYVLPKKVYRFKIKGDTQAGYALALNYNILDKKDEKTALTRMINNLIEKYDGRMSTGFLSTTPLMLELSDRGWNSLAYDLLLSKKLPSWGYSIEQGATTIWERWDAYVKGRGFQSKGMNSFNHYAYGSVGEWMYKNLLGIRPHPDSLGFSHSIISPKFDPRIKWIKGYYNSINGKIEINWKIKTNETNEISQVNIGVKIPPNTSATFHLQAMQDFKIYETHKKGEGKGKKVQKSLHESEGIKILSSKNSEVKFLIQSGRYFFILIKVV